MSSNSIFKILFAVVMVGLASMLYWSSLLQEQDLKKMRQEMKELRLNMTTMTQKIARQKNNEITKRTSYISDRYPNLLEPDDYLTKTLPAQLGDHFQPKGFLRKATIGRPENLHPFNGFRDIALMIDMCSGSLADLKVGCFETLAPRFAHKIEERSCEDDPDQIEYWVHLRDDLFWAPLNPEHFPTTMILDDHFFKKHPVTSHDFKFFYDAVMNPYVHEAKAASLRTYYNDIVSFDCLDDHTFVVRWRAFPTQDENGAERKRIKFTSRSLTGGLQPLACFVFQYFADGKPIIEDTSDKDAYKKNSIWAQNFAHHWAKNIIVSCGPYLFDGMTEEGITLRRNPNYFDPYSTLVEGIKYSFKESTDAIWQDFKAGKVDLCLLSPNQLLELKDFLKSDTYKAQKSPIHYLDYVDLSYYYIGWNQHNDKFADPRVRKALTLAIDRRRIIEQNLNMMGIPITGPFFRYSPAYNDQIADYPYDPTASCRLLDEAGWVDHDGDGVRDRMVNGETEPLQFKLYYYVKSLSTKVIAEYIVSALHTIGVRCELHGMDLADLSRTFEDKNFDALLMGWKLGTPPEDPRQLWHSSGALEKGSSNIIGFSNKEIDALIEKLSYEYDKTARLKLYHEFHQIIHDEIPYTFLYTPKVRLLYRERVQNIFIPRERNDLIPQANIPEPHLYSIWLKEDSYSR